MRSPKRAAKMGCEAEEYFRFWLMAKDFRHLDKFHPASLRRDMISFGVAQPMLHLARCRPVGLLFLLVKVEGRAAAESKFAENPTLLYELMSY